MVGTIHPEGAQPHVAIVGGGASGSLTAVQLLRRAAAEQLPLRVTLIDRLSRHGLGQAYGTDDPAHLLNAVAAQMSALPDDPDHLVRWAGAAKQTFLPRRDYGRYLRETLAEAEHHALPTARLTRMSSEVVAIRRNQTDPALTLTLSDGQLSADIAVLALGGVPARLPFPVPRSDRIITDPWLPGSLDAITDGRSVVMVGTGLTMMDIATAIGRQSRDTTMYALSRHGLLPRPHAGGLPKDRAIWLPAVARTAGEVRLSELIWQIRAAVAVSPANWPDIVDGIRPYVPGLWRRMSEHDKRQFLRHVSRYWEVHRHRVPPATASQIAALRCTGQLSILQGEVLDVTEVGGQLCVRIGSAHTDGAAEGADRAPTELPTGWLVNCTGAPSDIRATTDPLLRDLIGSGLARPDPLGLGLDATVHGAIIGASGAGSDVLYTLGPPLRGLWYETTAIPEIREQAAALARRITGHRMVRRPRHGSAA
jgi:uncharacterized NAD(P)/FAD-binding protein YdhS